MNKKGFLFFILIFTLLVLSACSNSNEAANSNGSATTTAGVLEGEIEIDQVGQLALGTIMLDGTENVVTAEQAQTMLPLWQLYQSMMSEDTTASEELDAILSQIEKAFTKEQLSAMESLDYSNSMQIMAQMGLRNGFGAVNGESGERPEITQGGGMNGGGMNGGDRTFNGEMPSGGSFPSGDDLPSGSEDFMGGMGEEFGEDAEGNTSDSLGRGFGNMQTQMYIPAVIEYLEAIISE